MYGQRVKIGDENRSPLSPIQVTAKMSNAGLEKLRGDGARHLVSQVFHYVSVCSPVLPASVRRE